MAPLVDVRGDVEAVGKRSIRGRDIGFFESAGTVSVPICWPQDIAAREFSPNRRRQAGDRDGERRSGGVAGSGRRRADVGRPDRKEGLYVGTEHPPRTRGWSPGCRCTERTVPRRAADLGPAILEWLTTGTRGGRRHAGIAIGVGLAPTCSKKRDGRSTVRSGSSTTRRGRHDWASPEHRLRLLTCSHKTPRWATGPRPERLDRRSAEPTCSVQHRRHARPLTVGRYRSTPHRVPI